MAMEFEASNYMAEILDHKIAKSNNGNFQLVFSIRPVGEIDPKDPNGEWFECPQGKTRTIFATITEKTKDRRVAELKAMGYTGKGWGQLDKDASGSAFISLIGKTVPVACKSNVYNGQEKEQWEFNFPGLGGPGIEGVNSEEVRKLDALFGGAFGDESNAPTTQATTTPASEGKREGKAKKQETAPETVPW